MNQSKSSLLNPRTSRNPVGKFHPIWKRDLTRCGSLRWMLHHRTIREAVESLLRVRHRCISDGAYKSCWAVERRYGTKSERRTLQWLGSISIGSFTILNCGSILSIFINQLIFLSSDMLDRIDTRSALKSNIGWDASLDSSDLVKWRDRVAKFPREEVEPPLICRTIRGFVGVKAPSS